jgi:hypothetical protein
MRTGRLWVALAVAAAFAGLGCQSPERRARAELSARLKQSTKLTKGEQSRLFAEIGRAIDGKVIKIRQGAVKRALDKAESDAVLGMLVEPDAVYDIGLRVDGPTILRGLESGGTPVHSEVDAKQALWIDVETFLPKRYEFAYSMPGLGDVSYDLLVDQ